MLVVGPVDTAQAVAFVRKWHYSGTASAGTARYGWWRDGDLIGVSIFNTGNRAMQAGVFGPGFESHVWHHHRLAVRPDVKHGLTSQFQSGALRELHKDHPDVWAVVTYADRDQGHVGTIYQATNAIYTGIRTKGNLYFLKPDGSIGTMQSLKDRGTWPERRVAARELGWEERRSSGKYRYVYLLGTTKQRKRYPELKWPVLPYPGKEQEDEES